MILSCYCTPHSFSCMVLSVLTAFRLIPYPLEKGHLFYPYPGCTETADRELLPCECTSVSKPMCSLWFILPHLAVLVITHFLFLTFAPAFHEVSVYPKKELPFFILFTAGLCSFTAMLAMLTHQFPELMGVFAKAVSTLIIGNNSSPYMWSYRSNVGAA